MLKKKNILISVAGVWVLLCSSLGLAQELTWDDCVVGAAKDNLDILSTASTLSSNAYKAKAAYSGFLPQFSGNVNYNFGSFSTGLTGSYTTDAYSASVTADQNVFPVISAMHRLFGKDYIDSILLSALSGWTTSISIPSVLLAFFFSASIGVTFGLYPARKASFLNPIEALRYE